eukprot:TRINITY_DN17161_c0_g1_i2.p1 TRINITY_DN17161_c0_g1~~TRINITY_DN17161_c0_g1_i2.p1  ORF type:complete len:262 (-),score=39.06 TRINITY_DN17161_c0_g1_i2:288-1073(-)
MPDMTSFMKSDMEAACRPSDASFADQVELPDSEEGHLEEAPWIGDSRIRILLAITIPLEVLLMVIKLMVVAYVSSEPYYVDALNYTAAIVRNVALLIHIPRIPEHTEHPTHFSTRRVLSEAFVGAPSVLLLELGVAAALSISLEIVALAHGEESLGIQVWLYIMQSTNFVVLFSLIMRMEQVVKSVIKGLLLLSGLGSAASDLSMAAGVTGCVHRVRHHPTHHRHDKEQYKSRFQRLQDSISGLADCAAAVVLPLLPVQSR